MSDRRALAVLLVGGAAFGAAMSLAWIAVTEAAP